MSFLKTVTIDLNGDPAENVLTQFWNDDVQAVVVKNVLSSMECGRLTADLDPNAHNFPKTFFPPAFRSFFLGANLNLADPELVDYFRMTPEFDRCLGRLTEPLQGFQSRVFDMFARLDGGRGYRRPPGPDASRNYMMTTFRAHLEGGYIPAHFDNEQARRPTFRHLAPFIEGDLASFVLTINRADEGGVLEVFDAKSDQFGAYFKNQDGTRRRPDLAGISNVRFDVDNGTAVILRSGHFLHRVTPVVGAQTRWTACSFMAKSRLDHSILCWG